MKNDIQISIIICTYNRAHLLKRTLDSILSQNEISWEQTELIIIDNNSSDETPQIVMSYKLPYISYIKESNQGLSWARNRGINEAQGEILIFTDDDVIVDKLWVANIYTTFKRFPDCVSIGGRVLPDFGHIRCPEWIKRHYKEFPGPIVLHDHGDQCFEYKDTMCFAGANMAFRRLVFDKYGNFNTNLGFNAKHKIMIPGEETELFNRIQNQRGKIIYCGKAVVYHPVEQKRCSLLYIIKWYIGAGRANALKDTKEYRSWLGVPLWVYRQFIEAVFSIIIYIFSSKRYGTLKKLCISIGQAIEYRNKYYANC